MHIRTHIGVSLDGFVATAGGLPVWDTMPTFTPDSYGNAAVLDQCAALVMGRSSFDQGFEAWLPQWPWPDQQLYVLTSHPLPSNVPAGVIAASGAPAGLVAQLRAATLAGDVLLHGGARTIQAFLDLGAIDRLELVVLPVLLGTGIPLFAIEPAPFSSQAWAAAQENATEAEPRVRLRLDSQRAFPDGGLELVYLPQ